jgi:hypothetical protein
MIHSPSPVGCPTELVSVQRTLTKMVCCLALFDSEKVLKLAGTVHALNHYTHNAPFRAKSR